MFKRLITVFLTLIMMISCIGNTTVFAAAQNQQKTLVVSGPGAIFEAEDAKLVSTMSTKTNQKASGSKAVSPGFFPQPVILFPLIIRRGR